MRSFASLDRLRYRPRLAVALALGFICRALIPAGFMPAAIGAGGPIAVCHGGLAGAFFRQIAEDRGGHGAHGFAHGDADSHAGHQAPDTAGAAPDQASHEAWEHCPIGAAFGPAAVGGEFAPDLLTLEHELEPVEPARPAAFLPVSSYRARAPPSSAIHS